MRPRRAFWVVMAGLAALVAASGCEESPRPEPGRPAAPYRAEGISVWHDDKRGVTCWVYSAHYKGGISCVPDSQLGARDNGGGRP